MAQIHLIVDDEQKERWENHTDENPQYDNLSQLIRYSVANEIHGSSETGGLEPEVIENHTGEVISEIDQLDRNIRAIDSAMVTQDELDEVLEAIAGRIDHQLDDMMDEWEAVTEHAADRPSVVQDTVERIEMEVVDELNNEIETVNGEETEIWDIYYNDD